MPKLKELYIYNISGAGPVGFLIKEALRNRVQNILMGRKDQNPARYLERAYAEVGEPVILELKKPLKTERETLELNTRYISLDRTSIENILKSPIKNLKLEQVESPK